MDRAVTPGKRQNPVFGKRKEPHTVIIARGNEVRHFTVRPWLAATLGSLMAAAALGYVLATTYLVLRDDLLNGAVAQQARLQQSYEDRISALRTQVDRITSRQLLDQQLMENKVAELIERQEALASRHGRLGPLLERAKRDGLSTGSVPVPTTRPAAKQARIGAETPEKTSRLDQAGALTARFAAASTLGPASRPENESAADRADRLFVDINRSLRAIEDEQISRIATLTAKAHQTSDRIADAMDAAGLKDVSEGHDREGVGGPLVPVSAATAFEAHVDELDNALERLDKLKARTMVYPLANPLPGQPVSSRFGYRRDPIIGTKALHAGMDFRASVGMPVRATASGKVIRAGWNGGYGRMVEIRHADGYTTRYAHMSKLLVSKGDMVTRGTIVGRSGNSGRSTGPHLHYEVRRDGRPVNPLQYLKAGRKIAEAL
ncbi:M23 family metallopeptidase [Zhengella sp. ZM62]|uniref:M23 family metallopeptidase n=1 Tax=Zhengella sedimenti TaxID=3390035 RepID=UPI0039747D94